MREIRRAMRAAARPNPDLNQIEADHWDRLNIIISLMHREAASQSALRIAEAAAPVKFITEITRTVIMDAVMGDFARRYGSELITNVVARTTINDIKSIVARGILDGLGEPEIAELIWAAAPTKSASRAQTIARTEVHSASTWATQEAAIATGVDFNREWVASMGERTRFSHSENANGLIVGMNEPFRFVGMRGSEVELMYPGEYNGAYPEETINCRCVVSYIPA